jgi:glycerophosphoryl diester phosphodiesterase
VKRLPLQYPPMSPLLLLGHRGARATKSVPENTIESFDLCLAHGCDGFEFDVRRTADGRAVICHDPDIGDLEIAKASRGELTSLPVLSQVLARYAQKAFLDIEIKVAGLERTVVEALRTSPPKRGYVVSSFLPDVLLTLSKLDPKIPLGLLCEDPVQLSGWKTSPAQIIIPHFALIDDHLCVAMHDAGKRIFAWTVNGKETMQRLSGWGVDGIISDDTKALVGTLRPTR